MSLIKPDAAKLAYLQARVADLAALHRDIAALSEATDLAALLRMGELVNSRLSELHPTVIREYEMLAFRAQVREMTDDFRRVLDHIDLAPDDEDEMEAISEAIDALSDVPDLDTLWDQVRTIRARLLNAWSTFIGDEEHDDWLEKLRVAERNRERDLK